MGLKPAEIGEAISLSISAILMLALMVYLTGAIVTNEDNPHVPVTAQAHTVVPLPGGGYILPLSVKNTGEKTLSYLKLSVQLGSEPEKEVEVEYLPRGSSRDIFLYVANAYSPEQIRLTPLYYKLD